MRIAANFLCVLIGCLAVHGVRAAEPVQDRQFTFAGTGSRHTLANAAGLSSAVSGLYGRALGPRVDLEVDTKSRIFKAGREDGEAFRRRSLSADATFNVSGRRDGSRTVFLLGGMGGAYHDFERDELDSLALIANVGLGIASKPLTARKVHLRLEARYVRGFSGSGQGEPRISLGFR
jgi:hypothetical protein